MDVRLFQQRDKRLPEFNKDTTGGLVCKHLSPEQTMAWIENTIRCGAELYPEGFEFIGSRRCTPYEEYREALNVKVQGKRVFDVAKNDVFLVRYDFTYCGQPLYPQYLYLPFPSPGGLIRLSDKVYTISPVLADKVFSVANEEIFIQVGRAKISFKRDIHTAVIDGKRVTGYLMWSRLHHASGRRTPGTQNVDIRLGAVNSTAVHYLFCRYGFLETFERFCRTSPVVLDESQYTEEEYPADKWVVCRSNKRKPRGVICGDRDYKLKESKALILIERKDYNSIVELFILASFYVIDHFPRELNHEDMLDTWTWKVALGYILFGDHLNEGKVVEDIETHLVSLDGYIDFEAHQSMTPAIDANPAGYPWLNQVDNLFDLLGYLIDRMPEMLLHGDSRTSCLYNKQLMINRYVLSNINNSLFGLVFKLVTPRDTKPTLSDLNTMLGKHFGTKLIFNIVSSNPKDNIRHGEISSVSNPNDNMFFKITSVMVQQSDSAGPVGKGDIDVNNPGYHLDSSFAEVSGYCVLPPSLPIGIAKINPFVKTTKDGTIVRREEFRTLLDKIQRNITRG